MKKVVNNDVGNIKSKLENDSSLNLSIYDGERGLVISYLKTLLIDMYDNDVYDTRVIDEVYYIYEFLNDPKIRYKNFIKLYESVNNNCEDKVKRMNLSLNNDKFNLKDIEIISLKKKLKLIMESYESNYKRRIKINYEPIKSILESCCEILSLKVIN